MILDPIRSLVDFSLYKEARQHSPVRCLAYMAYVGLLFSVFLASLIHIKARPFIVGAGEWLATTMPTLTFADGKATSAPARPVVIHPPKDDKLGILVDTSRTEPFTFEEMNTKSLVMAITQDALYVSEVNRGQIERRAFSELKLAKPLVLDASFYRKCAQTTLQVIYVVLLPLFCFFFVFWKLVSAFVYSLAGILINEATGAGLDFPTVYKLSVYAQTPWIVLQAAMMPIRRGFPWPIQMLLALLVTCTYLWKAISLAKDAPPPIG